MTLKEWPDGEGCYIHFGGCITFGSDERNLENIKEYTKATSVSGCATDSDWLEWEAPSILLELQLFWHLGRMNLQ